MEVHCSLNSFLTNSDDKMINDTVKKWKYTCQFSLVKITVIRLKTVEDWVHGMGDLKVSWSRDHLVHDCQATSLAERPSMLGQTPSAPRRGLLWPCLSKVGRCYYTPIAAHTAWPTKRQQHRYVTGFLHSLADHTFEDIWENSGKT